MSFLNGRFIPDKYPSGVFGGTIYSYANSIDDPQSIIDSLEKSSEDDESIIQWTASLIGRGYEIDFDTIQSNERNSKEIDISRLARSGDSVASNIHNAINDTFWSALIPYSTEMGIDFLDFSDYLILKYSDGGQFTSHFDGPTITGRCVSGLIYLNDNYEGGEIEFQHFNLKFKPKAGTMILFPSNYAYRHIAHPVISGTKYVVAAFFNDREVEFK